MPRLVGQTTRVVEFEGIAIDELVGNVATGPETPLSVAKVAFSKPTAEPWLTIQYDEWYCVLKGKVEINYYEEGELKILTLHSGETALISKGERFRPVFPVGGTECLAICRPAFTIEGCKREEDAAVEDAGIIEKDAELVDDGSKTTTTDDSPVIIYHMCEQTRWNEALASKRAYYPPTFEKDGGFTHATSEPSLLLNTANHFYVDSKDDWLCIALNQTALEYIGIATRIEAAKPVGEKDVRENDAVHRFPHIFGGIPGHLPGIVINTHMMKRDSTGKFVSIEGLVNSR